MNFLIFWFFQITQLFKKQLIPEKFSTINLISQKQNELKWNKFKYLIVGNKVTGDACRKWGEIIEEADNINKNEIGAIAVIPKWLTKSPGSKYILQKSVYLFENDVDIFIDWEGQFVKLNKINKFPTVIVIKRDTNNEIIELGRVSGNYIPKRWKQIKHLLK